MRINISLIIILATASLSTAFGQAWSWKNPLPNSNGLSSVWWVNANTGWAVESWGYAMKSTDAGATWKEQPIAPGTILTRVFFNSPQSGWVIGVNAVLHTTDGGVSWNAASAGLGAGIVWFGMYWITPQMGWVAGSGGAMYKTTNSGGTWSKQTTNRSENFGGVQFSNATTGFACGNSGLIVKTTNGGTSWIKLNVATTANLHDIAVMTPSNAIVVGDGGRIYASNDGTTWQIQNSPSVRNLVGVSFVDTRHGVIIGDGGTILESEDASTWNVAVSTTGDNLLGTHHFGANQWAAVGNAGQIIISTNGGRNWTNRTTGPTVEFLDVDFADTLYGWAVGRNGSIYRTTDGGTVWNNVSPPLTYHNINAVSFADRMNGWAVGDTAFILRTTNGGTTWGTENVAITTKMNFLAVKFVDALNGWICGSTGQYLFHTTNGGVAWTTSYTLIAGNVTLRGLAVNLPGIVAVGSGGVIYHSFNNGTTWQKQNSNTGQNLNSVSFINDKRGIAVGNAGALVSTTDAGTTWTSLTTNTTQNLLKVVMRADSTARACGTAGVLMRSTDMGSNWLFAQPAPTPNNINSVASPSARTAYAVGQFGTILRSYQPQTALATSLRAVHFDSVQVGTCDSVVVTALNTGDDTVQIGNVTFASLDTAALTMAPVAGLPVTLKRGESIALTVKYCPNDTGSSAALISIVNSSASSPINIVVDGYAGYLSFRGVDSMGFFNVNVGDEMDSAGYLVNTGSIPLRLKSMSITGPDSAMFVYNGTFVPTSINAGDSLRVQFNFYPTAPGPRTATVTFATNASSPVTIFLHGNDKPLGVDQESMLAASPALHVSPMPIRNVASMTVTGTVPRGATVILSDMLGRQLLVKPFSDMPSQCTLAIPAALPDGMYLLSVRSSSGMLSRPVIVVR